MSGGQATVARATAAVFVDGRRAGSAVLVGPRYLVTAAHVLQGQDPRTLARVAVEQVELEFPDQGPGGQPGRIAALRLDLGVASAGVDVAVLDLGEDRPGWLPAPVPVWPAARPPGRVQVFGYPLAEGRLNGVWRQFAVAGPAAAGTVQLDWIGDLGTFPGHAGGPVVDADRHALAGILVEGAERGRFDRFVPVTLIARVWPVLPRPWLMTGHDPGEARSHFTRRARGQLSAARGGDLFRGRTAALDRIRSWLTAGEPPGQPLVITGQPGAGKSAVLARAALIVEAERGGPGLAFHARTAIIGDFLTAMADLTGVDSPASIDELVNSLAGLPGQAPTRVVLDALDEAASDHDQRQIAEALAELAVLPGLRVAVATRSLTAGNPYMPGGLLAALGVTTGDDHNLVDLDSDTYFDLDGLREFAAARLAQDGMDHPGPDGMAWTQYRTQPEVRDRLAVVIADRARRNFLAAALVADQLSTARKMIDPAARGFNPADIDSGVEGALGKYLGQQPEERREEDQSPPPLSAADDAQQVERRVLAGGISADLVDPDQGIPKEEDDLGVSTYVAMLATAIARKDTKLPLSIGLFGEWGSGKSYFMGLLRKQIQELTSSGDPAYYSGIVQIGFNAWSYADANLWASLGDEIFRELAGPTHDEQDAEDRERREQLRMWLADQRGRVKELEAAKAAATAEVAKLRAELERRERDRRNSALILLRATVEAVQADEQKAAELRSAWKKLGLKDETEQARLLADAVTGTRDDVTAIRRAAADGNRRYLVAAILAAGLVLAIAGLASSGVLAPSLSRVLTGTGLATLLAAAVTFATATKRVADGVRSVADLANQIRQRTQAGKNEQVKSALDQVRVAEAREQVLQAQLDQVVARVGELGRELVELSPGQRLYAFIAERAASEDYRRQLGLIATIRRDFERLTRLQEQWRKDMDGDSPRPIDRIVLYIDDLDRCTPRQVVEVLQAVHLLLALDLFVVVVGVDPRWLLHSLRDQYRSMLTAPPPGLGTAGAADGAAAETSRGRDGGTVQENADRLMLSTPHDYLEKIFNVPFVLPTMTPQGFDAMIRRLSITEADVDHDAVPDGGRQASDDDHDVLHPLPMEIPPVFPEGGTPPVEDGSEIAAVQHGNTVVPTPLTEPELQALSSLAPLVRSPREAKRLLNLYRMLRSTRNLSDASRFLGADGAEGEFQAVAMLLGLLTANPRLLGQILFAPPDPEEELMGGICHRAAQDSWGAFLNGLRPRCVDECWRNDLCDGMSERDREEWELLVERAQPASALVKLPDVTTFKTWAPHVARFSFLLAPVTGGDRSRASSGKPDDV